ncbi:MAG: lipoprotein signal peptidase [Alphaproteobacteria bacterium]|nr:MAG: lipoprotein signal peptidase [Alphaproteobacteria bacterium]
MKVRRRLLGLGLAAFALGLDQIVKYAVLDSASLAFGGVIELAPWLDLVLVRNTGVSFGLLQAAPLWLLAAITLLIVLWFAVWMWREARSAACVGLGLIIGGAVSNLADRLGDGAVTDFIDAHWGDWSWPTFNVADVAITVGAAILLLAAGFDRRETAPPKPARASTDP